MQLRKIFIPYVPGNVVVGSNGKVLPDDEINYIKSVIKTEGKYSRKQLDSEFPCVFTRGKYFILFSNKHYHEGGFGRVIPAQDADTGEFIVFKIISRDNENKQLSQSLSDSYQRAMALTDFCIEHEAEFLSDLDLAVTDNLGEPIKISQASRKYPGMQKYMMTMKWVPGESISAYKLARLPFVVRLEVVEKMLHEVKRSHDLYILHRDLKPDNFMLDYASNSVKLIDYGLARYMDDESASHDITAVGLSDFLAPELKKLCDFNVQISATSPNRELTDLQEDMPASEYQAKEVSQDLLTVDYVYNEKTEIYALGVTINALLQGDNHEHDFVGDDVSAGNVKKYKAQCEKMQHKDPAQRPSIDECIRFFHDMQTGLNLKERTFRIGLIDISELDDLRLYLKIGGSSGDFNKRTETLKKIVAEYKNFHRIIFYDKSAESDKQFYADLIYDLSCHGFRRFSREVYLAPLDDGLIMSIHADLCQQHPLYHHRLYDLHPDRTIEIKLPKEPSTSIADLAVKFGQFSLNTRGAQESEDQCVMLQYK